tara:strand:- start:165 stop:386 length:222 start_codon:yes stop_codon:yes gene_type:complete
MILVNKIKLARVKNGDLTQQELADKVGCSRQTINSIEKGKFKPSIELVLKLARVLDTQVEEMFYLDTEEENEK